MKAIWVIAVIFVIVDCVYLMTYFNRLLNLLEGIQKDTRELIVRARKNDELEADDHL